MKVTVRPRGIYINGSRYNYTILDNFFKSPMESIDIDMFGSEIDVLKGAAQIITKYRPDVIITLHEDRIMKERERIIGFFACVLGLPINIKEDTGKLYIYISDDEVAETSFGGHKFKYYRNLGPESIMYFTGWTSEVLLREKLLKDDEVVYDVGAHIGGWTIPAALVGKHVYSFEPNHDCISVLSENILLNKLEDKISVYNVSLASVNGNEGKVNACFSDNNTTLTARLDDFGSRGAPPDFIKIDVEGAELDVLMGAQETIKKFKPRIFVEAHLIDGYNTYDDILDFVLKIVPDYLVESEKGAYHIFWPPK